MAVPIALAGAGKLAMQVLPFLPGIASAVQGDYGKGAAQAATAYGIGKIPGVGKLAGMGPAGQAAALGFKPSAAESVAAWSLTLLAPAFEACKA